MDNKLQKATAKTSEKILWLIVFALLAAGVFLNYRFAQVVLTIRLAGWVVLACIIVLIIFQTELGKQFWKFFKDSKNEMRRVVWPSRQQTFHQTLLVCGIVIIFAIIMWGFDSIIQWAFHFVIGG